jgi:hypothetical protein
MGLPSGFRKGLELFKILKKEMGIVESFKEFIKIYEVASLSKANLSANPIRYDNFKTKIEKGEPFKLIDGDTVELKKIAFPEEPKDLPAMRSVDDVKISWNKLEKTAEFGGQGSKKDPSAAQWEALICIGVKHANKIDPKIVASSKEWESVGKFWDTYGPYAMKLGEAFKEEFNLSDLKQLGSSTLATNKGWIGSNKTPKTDMIYGNMKLSLKKVGDSQLMSAGKDETISTFEAAREKYSEHDREKVQALIDNIKEKMNKMETAGTITKLKKLKEPISAKDQARIKDMVKLEGSAKELTDGMNEVFGSNEFKQRFCWEAASGETKFEPSPDGIANWIVTFNPTGTIPNKLDLHKKNREAASVILANGNNFYISFKTGSSGSKPYLALRSSKAKKFTITDSFSEIVKQEFLKESYGVSLLNEAKIEQLDEFQMFDKLKRGLKNVSSTITGAAKRIWGAIMKRINDAFNYIKRLGKRMLEGLMQFFGIEVKGIKVRGGGVYPLL